MTILMNRAKAGPSTNDNNMRKRENGSSDSPIFLTAMDGLPTKRRRCNIVEQLLLNQTPRTVLRTIKNIQLTGKDFWTLRPAEWLNDQIMNAYFELIQERSAKNSALPKVHVFSTFFYATLCKRGFEGVKRWTNKIDIFSYDLLLVPIHWVDHWSLVAIDLKKDVFAYFDSMEFYNTQAAIDTGKTHIKRILNYMKSESLDKRNTVFVRGHTRASTFNEPIQMNETDCGVFVCCYAENLARGKDFGDFDFKQYDMPRLRRQICYELGDGRLVK